MRVRTRFAPSPTGFMHIGNLRTALYAYLYAKHYDGDFVLRIEDTDQERLVEGAIDLIYRTLSDSGIHHNEGPDKDGGYGPYIQSQRLKIYQEYAHELVKKGGAYYCFCSKERLATLGGEGDIHKYDKHCLNMVSYEDALKRIANGEPYVIRQNIPLEGVSEYDDLVYGHISVACEDLEDNILLKSDGYPTYNFANVIDDHLMNITHVMRGTEYLSSTPKYNLLYDAFGWDRPQYIHLPPIMKDATRKLSKRYGDANYEDFIKKGYLPEAIINFIALLGWSPKNDKEKLSMQELIELFSVTGINKSSSIFDEAKMRWLNSVYIKELTIEEFNTLAIPYYNQSVINQKYDYMKWSKLLQNRIEIFSDVIDKVAFIENFGAFDKELLCNKKWKTDSELAKQILPIIIEDISAIDNFTEENIHNCLISLVDKLSLKKGQILWIFRIAITATESTPGGATEMADILGKDKTLERLTFTLINMI